MRDETANIYVTLDALLDTRLAVLHDIDPVRTEYVLKNGYYRRLYDEFDGFDTQQFKEAYANRNASVLKNAVLTGVYQILNFFATRTLVARVSTPFRKQPKLVLNIYPYKLSDSSINNLIVGIATVTNKQLDIEVVNESYLELTPSRVKKDFACLVLYDYWEWLEEHSKTKELSEVRCNDITLIGPAIVRSKEVFDKLDGVDIFKAIEGYASLFIKLNLYPITTFSLDLERKIEGLKKQKVETTLA